MSGDEKAQQIGQVVTEYQNTKVELGHVETKLIRIGAAYAEVGKYLSESSPHLGYKIEKGHIYSRYPRSGDLQIGPNLLDEEALMVVIAERDRLKQKVSDLLSRLKSLGITNLE